jgi:hypothetical protein
MVDEAAAIDDLTRRAAEFERAWTERAAAAERLRARRARRAQRQFWFLFFFLFASFILLAWRTESNSYEIRVGFWQECSERQGRIVKSNEGREALIKAVITNPERPVPTEKQAAVIQQLRDGLLLPLEDCGPNPGE